MPSEEANNATFTLLTFNSTQKEGTYVWQLPEKKFVERGTITFNLGDLDMPLYFLSDVTNDDTELQLGKPIGGQEMVNKKITLTFEGKKYTEDIKYTFDFSKVLR